VRKLAKKEAKREEVTKGLCKDCKFYDKSTEQVFHGRPGGSKEIKEQTRAVCRNKEVPTFNHRVKNTSQRECFVAGVYVAKPVEPEKSEKPKEKKNAKEKPVVTQGKKVE
jgi:hypothetical protein